MDLAQRLAPDLIALGILPPGERVLVGVSGGADSVCLLHLLHTMRVPLVVAHYDHGLRRSSWADARYVLRLAAALGLPAIAERAAPGALAQGAGSLEERARRARYRFLATAARESSCLSIAVGHTQDDQAETVLLHLLRGAGTHGLRGMRPTCSLKHVTGRTEDLGLRLIRPLLTVTRAETFAYCRAARLAVRRDPTNEQTTYLRNRVRLELLPILKDYNPSVVDSLARTADLLAGDAEALDSLLPLLEGRMSRAADGRRIDIARRWLLELNAGLQRVVVRDILRQLSAEGTEIGFRAVERARAAVATGARTSLPGDLETYVEQDRQVFSPVGCPPPSLSRLPQLAARQEILLEAPCAVALEDGWALEVVEKHVDEPIETVGIDASAEVLFDADALGPGLVLRVPAPGDRMTPFGAHGSRKITDLLQQHRIPVAARAAWPVVCASGTIAWLVGVRRAEGARVGPRTRRILHLRLRAPAGLE